MYKIYKAQITRLGPPATLIAAVSRQPAGYYKAESFCAFPDPHPGKSYSAARFEAPSADGAPAPMSEAAMLEDAVAQARLDIARHIDTHYSAKLHLIAAGEPVLTEVDSSYLVQLWVRKLADFLPSVCDQASSAALRDLLSPIVKMPTVARRDG